MDPTLPPPPILPPAPDSPQPARLPPDSAAAAMEQLDRLSRAPEDQAEPPPAPWTDDSPNPAGVETEPPGW